MKSASIRAVALIVKRVHAKLLIEQPPAHSKGRAGHVSYEVFEPKAVFATAFTGVLGSARTVRDLLLLSSRFEESTCASSSGSCASADGSLRVSGRSSQGA
jgi:hypothetical protein